MKLGFIIFTIYKGKMNYFSPQRQHTSKFLTHFTPQKVQYTWFPLLLIQPSEDEICISSTKNQEKKKPIYTHCVSPKRQNKFINIYLKTRSNTVSKLVIQKYNLANEPKAGLYELWKTCHNKAAEPTVSRETFHILKLSLISQFTALTLLMVHTLFLVKF